MLFTSSQKKRENEAKLQALTPIILMGRGHSGTRVLSWVCAKLGLNLGTSESLATGDADDQKFTQQIKKIAINTVGSSALQAEEMTRFQKAVLEYYQRLGSPKAAWGWKFPETYLIAPYIAQTFPQAKYIHLIRDGRDIAFKEHLTDDPHRKLGKLILSHQNALDLPHHLQAAISWAFQVDQFDQFRQSVTPSHVLDVSFEQLCLTPQKVVAELCKFLDLPMTKACESYIQNDINLKKVAQYRENDSQLVQEVETHIGPTLKRYGYLE